MTDTKSKKSQEELSKDAPLVRRRIMMINPAEFASLFVKGLKFAKATYIAEGVPEDFTILGVVYDIRLDAIMILGESDSFDEIPMTEVPPRQMISIEQGVAPALARKKSYRKK